MNNLIDVKTEYHKIQTVFKRDPATNHRTLLEGQFSIPVFEYLQHNDWVFTEKVDGTNMRVMYNGYDHVTFGGKTDRAQIPEPLHERLVERFSDRLKQFQSEFGDTPVTLYGEGYGPKIQNGGKYRQDTDFVLFDVRVGDWWLERNNVVDVAEKFELDVVPIVGTGTLWGMVERVVNGHNKSFWGDFQAEGLVARPSVEMFARNGARIITKIKARDFAEVK